MKKILVAAGLILAVSNAAGQEPDFNPSLPPSLGMPAGQCGPRSAIINALKDMYGEIPRDYGLGNDGQLFEVFISTNGDTWSITSTAQRPGVGLVTCLRASGENWSVYPAPSRGL